MKTFFKKILGLDKLEQEKDRLEKEKAEALALIAEAQAKEELAKLSPKEKATAAKEPWVAVLDTHVNKENIRNGFFELDWNEYFVVQLRQAGYTGNTEEEIVDQWFSELCRNVAAEEGVDMNRRGSGYVNRALRDDGKTEVS